MLKPTGFWSYASSDDESSRGRLSQLRSLLAGELQQQIGRIHKVNIFQDVAAIPPGAEWEYLINSSIESSSFMIPIITPAFLQSEWCAREVNLFQQQQKKIGYSSLIFPIHYIDVYHMEARIDNIDGEVLAFLKTLQWADFRSLRLKNPDSSESVAVFLERFAQVIAAALRAASPVRRVEIIAQETPPSMLRTAKSARGNLAEAEAIGQSEPAEIELTRARSTMWIAGLSALAITVPLAWVSGLFSASYRQSAALDSLRGVIASSSEVTGIPIIIDSGTLLIDGKRTRLFGINGSGGDEANKLDIFIREQGGSVTCAPVNLSYRCHVGPNRVDLSEAILLNGAASAASDATDNLRQMEQTARRNGRGIWKKPGSQTSEAPWIKDL